MKINRVAVVGAGNMGSGIAQKIATEGVAVTLIDATLELATAGKQRIERLLMQGLERQLFTPAQVDAILARVTVAGDPAAAAPCDLVIEAVFEDLQVKRALFAKLGELTPATTLLATNTSSFLVADVAAETRHPERVIGLHYFYHPAKNRLVEVIGHAGSDPEALRRGWLFQSAVGKTPIASADAPGFVVNRFFVPWLNEAVRLHEEGIAIATVEGVAKGTFGIGMGPFELMNVTGLPITLHAARALADRLGPFYAPSPAIALQVHNATPWELDGEVDTQQAATVADRLTGVVFHVALQLASEGVGSLEEIDTGARVGLRWPIGPVELMNSLGLAKTAELCEAVQARYDLPAPALLGEQRAKGTPFALRRVQLDVDGASGLARITLNRPDQLNALDPSTVEQLADCFARAEADPAVRGVILAGAGKAFVAGADVKFFVDRIRSDEVAAIVDFASRGQALFQRIATCAKPVICQLDGMALGGGAELALACHAIVATPRATFAFPESGIGIYPGLGGTQRLTQRLGKGLARYLLYTGDTLTADALAQLGLAWRVVDPAEMDAALAAAVATPPPRGCVDIAALPRDYRDLAGFLGAVHVTGLADGSLTLPGGTGTSAAARKIRRKARNALMEIERLTELAEQEDEAQGLAAETAGLHAIFSHPNALEGMSALLAGRRPSFRRDD